jgi:carboxyl-terminal processing protease
MMKKIKTIVCLILVVCFIYASAPVSSAIYDSYLGTMLEFMTEMYYEGLTDEEGLITALKGMFSGLDEYSGFYDRDEMEAWYTNLDNSYVGIGAVLENHQDGIRIVEIFADSPAEKAGLKADDIITAVDGVNIVGMDSTAVAAMIRGKEGTIVKLTVRRGNSILDFSIVRAMVIRRTVYYRIEDKTGYIKISSFSDGTSSEFSNAMDELDKNNVRKIILDLRGNSGGYVDEAVAVANELIPKGIITKLDYKSELFNDQVYYADGNHPSYLIAVLVDEGTASASEILAGAIVDSGVGFLVGQKTFGKGIFQSMFSVLTPEAYYKYRRMFGDAYVSQIEWFGYYGILLSEDELLGAVKITTGYYLTPKGRNIHEIGLIPDIVVENPTYPNGIALAEISPLTGTGTIKLDANSDEVYDAKKILAASGYFKAVPDRLFTKETVEAVKKYQADMKLPVTGEIDARTREKLNSTLYKLRSENDKQYTKAVESLGLFRD